MTTPRGPGFEERPPRWAPLADRAPLDPRWPVPVAPQQQTSISLPLLAVIAATILVLGVVGTAGGFARRTDLAEALPLGSVADVGSFTFTLTRADVSLVRPTYGNDPPHWALKILGTATNTAGEQLILNDPGVVGLPHGRRIVGYDVNVLHSNAAGELVSSPGVTFEPNGFEVPIAVTGKLPSDWQPESHLFVGIRVQEKRVHSTDVGGSQPRWANGDRKVVGFWVPVRVVPA